MSFATHYQFRLTKSSDIDIFKELGPAVAALGYLLSLIIVLDVNFVSVGVMKKTIAPLW